MNLDKTYKTFILCLIFISATASGILGETTHFLPAALFGVFICTYKNIFSKKFAAVCIATLALGLFYIDSKKPIPDALYKIAPTKTSLTGRVISQPRSDLGAKTKFILQTSDTNSKTMVSIYDRSRAFDQIKLGDIVKVTGSVKKPYPVTNPGQFDYGKYLANQSVFTLAYASGDNFEIIKKPDKEYWAFMQNISNIRNKIIAMHKKYLPSPKVEILGGIVFGNAAVPAPYEIKQDFINSGLLHLLAASGINVALIFGIWFFIARRLKIPYKIIIVSGGLLVAIYALMTGLPPSVCRAALMLEFILLGKLLDRSANNIALLSLICALMLLYDPYLITNIGFQLSFLVTFGLLLCTKTFIEKAEPAVAFITGIKFIPEYKNKLLQKVLNPIRQVPSYICGLVLIPAIAQLWAAPLQMFHFNTFVPYSIVANIIVMPFMGIISFAGFAGSIMSLIPSIGQKICFLLDKIAEPFIDLLLSVSKHFAQIPDALIPIGIPSLSGMLFFYGFILLFTLLAYYNFQNKKANIAFALFTAIFIASLTPGIFNKEMKMVFFDAGQGDAILIVTPEKKSVLVDTGNPGKYNTAKTAIVPYLKDLGIKELDALVLTHPDTDHIGGSLAILKNMPVKTVYHNGQKSKSKFFKKLQNYLTKSNIKTQILNTGNTINIDHLIQITAIKPDDKYADNYNDDSIVLLVKYRDFSALLMADSEYYSFKQVKDIVKEAVDVIKIGHHGSYRSTTANMLEYLKPQTAVISVGENSYGHPHTKVTDLLNKNHIETFRTDKDQAIIIKTNGKTIKKNNFKESGNKAFL